MKLFVWLKLSIVFTGLVMLTACGFKDIDKRFFVVSIGIDPAKQEDKNYKVNLKLAIPSPTERFGSNKFLIVSEESDSIAQAVRIIKSKVDKELDFGHAKAILFNEALLQRGKLQETMDWFIRRRDLQMIAWVGIAKPDTETVLRLAPKTERLPSNQLFLFFGQTGTETAFVVSERLFDFRRRLTERGLDPILPIIQAREDQQIAVNRLAVFDKNMPKLTLEPLETSILNSLNENVGKYEINVPQKGATGPVMAG